jgi:probable addiction module antidote protein
VANLRDPDEAKEFLEAAIKEYENDEDTAALMLALRYITEAQVGVPHLSRKTHLNKQNLYKLLTGKNVPRYDTMLSIFKGLGFHIVPQHLYSDKKHKAHTTL